MTAKPHGRDCPDRCSICIGAVPRKVEQDEDVLLVDGVPIRAIAGPLESYRNYRKRGRK